CHHRTAQGGSRQAPVRMSGEQERNHRDRQIRIKTAKPACPGAAFFQRFRCRNARSDAWSIPPSRWLSSPPDRSDTGGAEGSSALASRLQKIIGAEPASITDLYVAASGHLCSPADTGATSC